MPKARIKDIEMYYEVHGTGTPLVHIGGLAGDARAWARQIQHLSKHYQVICFDNRGTGRTSCPDMPYSTKLFAEDTVGLMDALGVDRAHIYGISMGGCIVQEIAINHPRRVLSLIINCSFAKFDRFGARITENIMNVYKSQGAAEAARHITIASTCPRISTATRKKSTPRKKQSQTHSVRHMPSSIRRWPVWSTIHVHGSAAFVFQLW